MKGEVTYHMTQAAIPIGYISIVDDPLKWAGLIVLLLQGVYWFYKIRNEKRKAKDE